MLPEQNRQQTNADVRAASRSMFSRVHLFFQSDTRQPLFFAIGNCRWSCLRQCSWVGLGLGVTTSHGSSTLSIAIAKVQRVMTVFCCCIISTQLFPTIIFSALHRSGCRWATGPWPLHAVHFPRTPSLGLQSPLGTMFTGKAHLAQDYIHVCATSR